MEVSYKHMTSHVEKERLSYLIIFVAEGKSLDDLGIKLPKSIASVAQSVLKSKNFKGKVGETEQSYVASSKVECVYLVGLGSLKDIDMEILRRGAGLAGQAIVEAEGDIGVMFPSFLKKSSHAKAGVALAEGLTLGSYEYKRYKTNKGKAIKKPAAPLNICVFDPKKSIQAEQLELGHIRAEATNFARDLGNTPANDMTPSILAQEAEGIAQEHDLQLRVLDEAEMKKLGMNMLLGVSKGSVEPAKLIILEHHAPKSKETIAFVGKGVTFDSGGISLKPGRSMDEMKFDMCGSAAVLGAMKAVGALKPKVNVIGVVGASENLPSGEAQKPGDIVKSLSGKTVEVLNTDAEGRLILGDALTYVEKTYKPNAIVDLATLTGACITALGHYATGAVSNNEDLVKRMIKAGKSSGDRVWELPSFEEYEDAIKGKYADIKNLGDGTAGTISAGLFLKQFIQKTPWCHLDIAGTAWNVKKVGYIPNTGATGVGVRLLLDLIS